MRTLIGQSDQALATFLRKSLEAEGYAAAVAGEYPLIRTRLMESHFHLLILDTDALEGIPAASSAASRTVSLVQDLIAAAPGTALLVITAQAEVEQRVAALDAGADDFLAKPFSYFELAARIRAVLRRHQGTSEATIQIGELTLDRIARTVARAGRNIELTSREFRLLEFLMRHYGRQISRAAILDHVWGDLPAGRPRHEVQREEVLDGQAHGRAQAVQERRGLHSMTNIVDVYVNYLRQKLGDTREKRLIHTVRGVGYRLGGPQDAAAAADPPAAWQARAC